MGRPDPHALADPGSVDDRLRRLSDRRHRDSRPSSSRGRPPRGGGATSPTIPARCRSGSRRPSGVASARAGEPIVDQRIPSRGPIMSAATAALRADRRRKDFQRNDINCAQARRRRWLSPSCLALRVAACGGSGELGRQRGRRWNRHRADGDVTITADDLAFNLSTINATSGEEFTITFTNNENMPHNMAVYVEDGGEDIVVGEVITGPDATTQIVVPALDAGTYFFKCDLHPDMNGSIVVSRRLAGLQQLVDDLGHPRGVQRPHDLAQDGALSTDEVVARAARRCRPSDRRPRGRGRAGSGTRCRGARRSPPRRLGPRPS